MAELQSRPKDIARGQKGATAGEQLYLVVAVGKRRYAVDVREVREVLDRPLQAALPSSEEAVAGVMFLRGRCVTVVDLGWRLTGKHLEMSRSSRIIVLRTPESVALLVDGAAELMTGSLESSSESSQPLGRERMFVVGKVLWNGRPLSVVDVRRVVS